MYAHPLRSTCFQDLNCVVPQALKPLALLLPLALTFPLAAVVCSLRFFFSFSCVRHFPRPPLLFSFNSTGANHNADSDNIGQSLCRFNQTHLLRRGQGDSDQIRLLVYWRRRKEGKPKGRNWPILQVGVKPGQLVAVHQVLGVAEVRQRVGVVAQVGQSVGMVVGAFHHGVQ